MRQKNNILFFILVVISFCIFPHPTYGGQVTVGTSFPVSSSTTAQNQDGGPTAQTVETNISTESPTEIISDTIPHDIVPPPEMAPTSEGETAPMEEGGEVPVKKDVPWKRQSPL